MATSRENGGRTRSRQAQQVWRGHASRGHGIGGTRPVSLRGLCAAMPPHSTLPPLRPHMWRRGKGGLGSVNAHEVGRVVQRRQVRRLLNRCPHIVAAQQGSSRRCRVSLCRHGGRHTPSAVRNACTGALGPSRAKEGLQGPKTGKLRPAHVMSTDWEISRPCTTRWPTPNTS